MGRYPAKGYCSTCRRRRVKCDRAKPFCDRCVTSGHRCGGYEVPLRMHNYGIVVEEGPSTSNNGAGPSGGQAGPLASAGASTRLARIPAAPPSSSVPAELSLLAFQESMAWTYFNETFVGARCWRLLFVVTIGEPHANLRTKANSAMVYGYMGAGHHYKPLQEKGATMYAQALQETRAQLSSDVSGVRLAGFVLALLSVAFYSVAVDKDFGLTQHTGMINVIEHCGPEAFQLEPCFTAFKACRAVLACHAFRAKQQIFLGQEEWKSIPWALQPKSLYDLLLDVFVDIPRIIEELEQAQGPQNIDASRKAILRLDVKGYASRLAAWRAMWETSRGDTAQEIDGGLDVSSLTNSPTKALLSKTIRFSSAIEALEIVTYDGALVYLMDLYTVLSDGHSQDINVGSGSLASDLGWGTGLTPHVENFTTSPLLLPSQVRDTSQPALEALRVAPFLYNQLAYDEPSPVHTVPLAPFGVLYCVWDRMPELTGSLPQLLQGLLWFYDRDLMHSFGVRGFGQHHGLE